MTTIIKKNVILTLKLVKIKQRITKINLMLLKKTKIITVSEKLIFSKNFFCCEFGEGRKRATLDNDNAQRNTSSKKLGCPFKLETSNIGNYLTITDIVDHVDHPQERIKKRIM